MHLKGAIVIVIRLNRFDVGTQPCRRLVERYDVRARARVLFGLGLIDPELLKEVELTFTGVLIGFGNAPVALCNIVGFRLPFDMLNA